MLKYIVFLFIFYVFHSVKCTTPRLKGSFKTTVIDVRNCSSKEVMRPHSEYGNFIKWHAEVYNSSGRNYIRANFTILKEIVGVKARFRSFIWEDDQWALRLHIPGFGCHRQIFRVFFQLINWKINTNKCSLEKGSGTIDRFEGNMLQHAWEQETQYGHWLWIYEATSKSRSVACFAVETVVSPINTAS